MLPNACNPWTPSASTNETRIKPFTPLNPVGKRREVKPSMKGADSLGFLKQGTPKLKSRSPVSWHPQTPGKGLAKRDQKNKENVNQEVLKTPGGSLKIDRPRPRYRTPTPAPKRRPAKI